jgi:hypothetical protein
MLAASFSQFDPEQAFGQRTCKRLRVAKEGQRVTNEEPIRSESKTASFAEAVDLFV